MKEISHEEIMQESLNQKHLSEDQRFFWREGARWVLAQLTATQQPNQKEKEPELKNTPQ